MKFETTTTEKREIEIPVPSFYKDSQCSESINDMIGIIDESTIVRVWESEKRTAVENYDVNLNSNEIVRAFHNYKPITEEQFLTAYNRALNSMSLTPELAKEL